MAPMLARTATRTEALAQITRVLGAAGIDEPRREASALLCAVLDIDRAALVIGGDASLGEQAEMLGDIVMRRARREPLSRILGRRAFWTLDLEIGPATLDPRPDTETVVEVVLAEIRRGGRTRAPLRILDLGTGSGAILLALLSELANARGIGIDISPQALAIARRNAEHHGLAGRVELRLGSWLDGITGPFDVIVSNPPYVRSLDIAQLDPEVRDHDPPAALDGGPDGLDAYRAIIPAAARLLGPSGILAVEIGEDQAAAVDRMMAEQRLAPLTRAGRVWPDLSGRPRCVAATT